MPVVRVERSSRSRPARGPSTMATATARLSVTIGFGRDRAPAARTGRGSAASRCPRPAAPRRAPRRWPPAAGTGRAGARASAAVTSATPSAIAAPVPPARGPARRAGPAPPSGPVRGGPAGVGEQHQREQPGDLAVVGQQPVQLRVSRIASAVSSARCSSGPRGGRVALVEDQVQHLQHHPQPLGELARPVASRTSRRPP